MSEGKADTVPGLGFKDKEKALDSLKILEGRDPDYQKLAVKGLIGRAKRVITRKHYFYKYKHLSDEKFVILKLQSVTLPVVRI